MRAIVVLSLTVALTVACETATPFQDGTLSSQGYQRPGWRRTLVHPEIEVFHAEEFMIDAENREEFDNLVRVVATAFEAIPEFDRRGPTFRETLREVSWRMQRHDRPARAILLQHVRRFPGGGVEAEGMVLSLATLLEGDDVSEYYETLTLRLEDFIVEGAVDGEVDFIQLLLDTNTSVLGAMEVLLDREAGSRSPGWRVRVSRVYDSGPLMREGTGTHQATDFDTLVNGLEEMIWRPFAGPHSSDSVQLPEGVILVPRAEQEIPRGTNFSVGE